MSLPTMTGTGRLTADPELRFAQSGTAVAMINLAFNARKYNQQSGQWEDGDRFFLRATLFGQHAEHASQTYQRGTEVVVTGRLRTDQWQDKTTGENRTGVSLLIDSLGASTRFVTAVIQKSERPQSDEAPALSDAEPPF